MNAGVRHSHFNVKDHPHYAELGTGLQTEGTLLPREGINTSGGLRESC